MASLDYVTIMKAVATAVTFVLYGTVAQTINMNNRRCE